MMPPLADGRSAPAAELTLDGREEALSAPPAQGPWEPSMFATDWVGNAEGPEGLALQRFVTYVEFTVPATEEVPMYVSLSKLLDYLADSPHVAAEDRVLRAFPGSTVVSP